MLHVAVNEENGKTLTGEVDHDKCYSAKAAALSLAFCEAAERMNT